MIVSASLRSPSQDVTRGKAAPPRRRRRLGVPPGVTLLKGDLGGIARARHLRSDDAQHPPGSLLGRRKYPSTRRAVALNWRALHIAVRAIDAAIAGQRLQHRAASLAIIEILTRIRGHGFDFAMSAFRTSDRREADKRRRAIAQDNAPTRARTSAASALASSLTPWCRADS